MEVVPVGTVGHQVPLGVAVLGATMVTVAMVETLAKMALLEPVAAAAAQVVTEAIQALANLEVAAAVPVFTELIIQVEV